MLSQIKGLSELQGVPVAHIDGFMSFQALPEAERLAIMTAHVVCDHETQTLSIRFGPREKPFVSPEVLIALSEALK
jgi:hypothetical protein